MTDLALFEDLSRLTGAAGISGYESPVCIAAMELLRPYVDEVSLDRFGNVVGVRRCGKENCRRLLLDAHLDEVGMVVTGVEEGFLRFTTVGIDPRVLPDREVTVCTDPPRFGVITCLPPHVQSAADQDKAAKREELFVDVGLSREEAEAAIPVGTPVVYREPLHRLRSGRVAGKSLDDRACFMALVQCAALLKDKPLDVDVYFVGSSREEVGGYGARTAAFALKPDWCVAVDVTFARSAGAGEDDTPCKLGDGAAIGVGPVIPRWMSDRMEEKARAAHIPFVRELLPGMTGTDGDDFQIAREGIATAVVSLPLRYMHTPVEVIDLGDLNYVAALLAAFAENLGEEAQTVC